MKRFILPIVAICVLLLSAPTFANDNPNAANAGGFSYLYSESPENPQPRAAELPFDTSGNVKNSYFYMKDDGIFSDEEKDQEAAYIYQQCLTHSMRSRYYDCACIAGAFRIERDAPELVPQHILVSKVYNNSQNSCVNALGIAGSTYTSCIKMTAVTRNREPEEKNEKYCQCIANQTAANFEANPQLNLRIMEQQKLDAMADCRNKERRNSL